MTQKTEIFQKRKKELAALNKSIEKRLRTAPEGSLRISCSAGRIQYYYREKPSDRRGKYLPASKQKLVRQLAQKSYDEQVREAVLQEIKAMNAYETCIPKIFPETVYEHLPEKRRALVEPAFQTDEMFIDQWNNVSYTGKDFPPDYPEIYTDRGERVRSKSELIIAELLNKEGIPYRYEYPIKLKNYGYVYPDFTVLNVRNRKELYWEHFGMMDDPEYSEKAVRKLSDYQKNGLFLGSNLIITAETKAFPINTKEIKAIIDHYLR